MSTERSTRSDHCQKHTELAGCPTGASKCHVVRQHSSGFARVAECVSCSMRNQPVALIVTALGESTTLTNWNLLSCAPGCSLSGRTSWTSYWVLIERHARTYYYCRHRQGCRATFVCYAKSTCHFACGCCGRADNTNELKLALLCSLLLSHFANISCSALSWRRLRVGFYLSDTRELIITADIGWCWRAAPSAKGARQQCETTTACVCVGLKYVRVCACLRTVRQCLSNCV